MIFFLETPKQLRLLQTRFPAAAAKGGRFLILRADIDHSGLEERGYKSVSGGVATEEEQDRFLRDYIALVDALGDANGGRRLWWATNIAGKSRLFSPLIKLLTDFYRVVKALEEARSKGVPLLLVGAPHSFLAPLREVCEVYAVEEKDGGAWGRWKHRLKGRLGNVRTLLGSLRVVVERLREVRRIFPHRPWEALSGRPACLVKSFSYPSSFLPGEEYDDPFFKSLPGFLKERLPEGWEVPILTMCFDDRVPQYKKMAKVRGTDILPVEAFLGWWDICRGVASLLLAELRPFSCPGRLPFFGVDVAPIVRECLLSGGGEITFRQYLHYAIGKNVSRRLDLRACLFTMEGDPWEKMMVAGMRENSPEVRCMGVQHAVVMKAAAGMFCGAAEAGKGALPDYIACTGEEPAALLKAYGEFPPERILGTCALRYGYLYEHAMGDKTFDLEGMKVLVVLEGLAAADEFVEYVLREAGACEKTEFHIRAHPLRPLDVILDGLGVSLRDYGNVHCSGGGAVRDDVAWCDVVMYWGTTVSLEALMMRKPLVHFDNGTIPSCDPLFGFHEYKWVVGKGERLAEVLDKVCSVLSTPSLRERSADAGVRYIERYFGEVTPGGLERYLQVIDA